MTEERLEKIYKMTDKDARARAIDALPPKEYMEYMEYADRNRARKKEQNEAKAAASAAAESKARASAAEAKAAAPAADGKAQTSAADEKASAPAAEAKASAADKEEKQSVLTEHDLEQLYDMDYIARREALKKMDSSDVQLYQRYETLRDNWKAGKGKKKKWKEWSKWRKGWRIASFIVHMISMWYLYQTIYWFIRLEMWTRFDSLQNIINYSLAYNPIDPQNFVLLFVLSLVLWYLVATFDGE